MPISLASLLAFALIVGVGSTLALDLFSALSRRITGMGGSNWGLVGRWLLRLTHGQWMLADKETPTGAGERCAGWLFHYAIGIAYALLLPVFGGWGFVTAPTLAPVILVGLVLSTLAGTMILMPAMGGGFLGSRIENRAARLSYVVVAHAVFAAAQYGMALFFTALQPLGG